MGAPEKALENLGIDYNLIAYSEIDKYASKAYSLIHHIPESKNLGDITKIDENILLKDIDLLTYGFPCIDISIAGEKKGFIDADGNKTHSGLFFDALRIITAVQPKIAIAENVKNLTSKSFSSTFKLILDSLNEVGYTNYWKVLNAADYGIAQSRERVFIVSIRNDIDLDMDFKFPDGKILTTCLKDYLQSNVPKSFYLSEDQTNSAIVYSKYESDMKIIQIADLKHYNNDQMNRIYSPEGLCPTLKTVSGGAERLKSWKMDTIENSLLLNISDLWVSLMKTIKFV